MPINHDMMHAQSPDDVAALKARIAELEADNKRLKKCEIWMKQHFYCEEVIACESIKNRRLRRSLCLLKARYFWILMVYAIDLSKVANPSIIHKSNFLGNPTPRCMEEYQHEAELYDNARIKCLKKVEGYNV